MTVLKREYQTVEQFHIERAFQAARTAAAGGEGAAAALEQFVALVSDPELLANLPPALVLASFLRLLEPMMEAMTRRFDWNWHDAEDPGCCRGACPEMDESLHPDAMLESIIRIRTQAEGELAVAEVMEG